MGVGVCRWLEDELKESCNGRVGKIGAGFECQCGEKSCDMLSSELVSRNWLTLGSTLACGVFGESVKSDFTEYGTYA